jgi:hypothetical protein
VQLQAISDAGLPVECYVAFGPATIEAGTLRITEIPDRAAFPMTVKVVAWQYGRGTDPLVKTATPLEPTILLVEKSPG